MFPVNIVIPVVPMLVLAAAAIARTVAAIKLTKEVRGIREALDGLTTVYVKEEEPKDGKAE